MLSDLSMQAVTTNKSYIILCLITILVRLYEILINLVYRHRAFASMKCI